MQLQTFHTGTRDMQNLPILRVGEGHDTHRTISGRPLVLGGVTIPHDKGLDGHSDADVLLHAVIDALLGAAGRGDIGEWFPNNDPQWQGADSSELLAHVWNELCADGWSLVNLDCTISCERPRLRDHKSRIREQLANLLSTPTAQINVKAKSGENVGPVGRGEAMNADAAVLLARTSGD